MPDDALTDVSAALLAERLARVIAPGHGSPLLDPPLTVPMVR
jgi:hypothetical protein